MNRYYCTYCSKNKKADTGLLPAIERYISKRIRQTADQAKQDGAGFLILSGEFGLISSEQTIPDYDHLLSQDEVATAVEKVTGQLKTLQVGKLHFFHNDPEQDTNILPYLEVIERSCQKSKTRLLMHTFPNQMYD